jgi:hypothetical protein
MRVYLSLSMCVCGTARTELDAAVEPKQHIVTLNVPMNHLLRMQVFQPQQCLCVCARPVPNITPKVRRSASHNTKRTDK